jgi:UDP-glucuronate decarboxylase
MRRSDERAFAQFVFSVVDGRDIVLHSDGSPVRPFCYLADMTAALLRLLLIGQDGEAYNLANPSAVSSIRDLADLLASLDETGRSRVIRQDGSLPPHYPPDRDPGLEVNIAKVRALGWEPVTGLRDGFRRTVESYR